MPNTRSRASTSNLQREILRLRGDLITVATRISHDLRTPLNNINIACEMLKHGNESFFDSISDSTHEMSRLLGRISFMLKASTRPEAMKAVQMGEPVAMALQRLERLIFVSKASITQPHEWPEVRGVADWLETIWWNLIVNALEHGRTAPRIQLGWRKSSKAFRFQVKDDGGGITPEARGQLFQKFHTLYKLNSKRGIGLSIVQRLVELQGGTCSYQPVPGGASFFFTLPAKR